LLHQQRMQPQGDLAVASDDRNTAYLHDGARGHQTAEGSEDAVASALNETATFAVSRTSGEDFLEAFGVGFDVGVNFLDGAIAIAITDCGCDGFVFGDHHLGVLELVVCC
jgi:hypothetical protein